MSPIDTEDYDSEDDVMDVSNNLNDTADGADIQVDIVRCDRCNSKFDTVGGYSAKIGRGYSVCNKCWTEVIVTQILRRMASKIGCAHCAV